MPTTNETVDITIQSNGHTIADFTIPAFNRTLPELKKVVDGHWKEYAAAATAAAEPPSLGDFLLWLTRRTAETEPLTTG